MFQEDKDVMVHNGRFYIMEDEVAALSIRNLAKTVPDWNFWSACDQHPQSDLQPRVVELSGCGPHYRTRQGHRL
jgi:hypothetical protein